MLGRIGGEQVVGVFRERVSATPGPSIKVSPDLSLVHLFDKAGNRIE